jgi:hypothetical protein
MVNIDSCCFSVHESYAKPCLNKFDKISRQHNETEQTYYEAKNILTGLNKVTYLPETGIVTFDISGKLLSDEHKQLISQLNIEDCFKVINSTGYVEADCFPVLENSTVRKVDFTENILVSNVSEYLQAVSMISGKKYNKGIYQGHGVEADKTGVVFRGTFKTFGEYLIFYDKYAETKSNIAYKNILRIESRRSTFASIRNDVKANNSLFDILTSNEKPVLKVYSRITGMNETDFKLYDRMKNVSEIKQLLYEALLLQSGDDMETVKQYLLLANKDKRRANVSDYLKRIEIYKRNRNIKTDNTDYIKDILLKLSA